MFNHSLISIFMIALLMFAGISVVLGIIGISYSLYVLIQAKREGIKLSTRSNKKYKKSISISIASFLVMSGGLFWLLNFHPFENDYPTLGLAVSNAGYENLHEVDTDISSIPVVLAKGEHSSLLVYTYITKNTPFGLTKYFINETVYLISDPQLFPFEENTGEIDEHRVYFEYFPDICFGLVYSDKRDKIRINGKTPEIYDVNINGTNYVFWYVKNDGTEVTLTFE